MQATHDATAPTGGVLLTFRSIHRVLQCEALCQELRLAYRLLPTPKEAIDDCGLGVCVEKNEVDRVRGMLGAQPSHVLHAVDGKWEASPPEAKT